MIDLHADVAVLGAGFGGSLTAMLAKQVGLKPVLIERDVHPRFTIGESSTPQGDIVLAALAERYDLPRISPLAAYGSWKRAYPNVTCGLKRGFSYFHHTDGSPFQPMANRESELIVAASVDDEHSDTHWYREEFDALFVAEAESMGIPYLDRTTLHRLEPGDPWTLTGHRESDRIRITADFVVDATGPSSPLLNALGIRQDGHALLTNSRTIFSHFKRVARWQDTYCDAGGGTEEHPFSCDNAALHHVFDGGWMWVLRFENGVTSAGFVLDNSRHPLNENLPPDEEWQALLNRFPSIARQFTQAIPVMPLRRTGRMQRRASCMAGDNWAMLPYAAAFVDPLHSSGNAHTLAGIERLIPILAADPSARPPMLVTYEETTLREVALLDRIIHGCYQCFDRFPLFAAFAMFYFAGADFSERRRRAGEHRVGDAFLNADDPAYCRAVSAAYEELLTDLDKGSFARLVASSIDPWNNVGLCDRSKRNMYDYA